jgi:hypothetical protein
MPLTCVPGGDWLCPTCVEAAAPSSKRLRTSGHAYNMRTQPAATKSLSRKDIAAIATAGPSSGQRLRIWWRDRDHMDEARWWIATVVDSRIDTGYKNHRAWIHKLRYEADQVEKWHEMKREHWVVAPKACAKRSRGELATTAESQSPTLTQLPAPDSDSDQRSQVSLPSDSEE